MQHPINRYSLLIILTLIISITACKKSNSNNQGTNTTPSTPTEPKTPETDNSYKIEGLKDITLKSIDTGVIALNVVSNNTEEKKVTITAIDLPQNIKASFSSNGNVIPYNTDMTICTGGVPPGKYPITITAKSSTGKATNKYTANLTIINTDSQDCINLFVNAARSQYVPTYTEAGDSIGYQTSIGSPPYIDFGKTSGQITNAVIKNLIVGYKTSPAITYHSNHSTNAVIQINCSAGTIIMEETHMNSTGGGYWVSGSGTFDYFNKSYEFKYTTKGQLGQTFILKGKLKI